MYNYFICLLDCDCDGIAYCRGDIVVREPGVGPPGTAWASFEPPEELSGMPVLAHVADDGSGDLVFRYTVEDGPGFVIKARLGLPTASAVIERKRHPARDSEPPQRTEKIELKFGAGLAATVGRSFVGFVSKSRFQAASKKKATIYDDPLRWGMEEN